MGVKAMQVYIKEIGRAKLSSDESIAIRLTQGEADGHYYHHG